MIQKRLLATHRFATLHKPLFQMTTIIHGVFSIALAGPDSQSQGCGKRGHTRKRKIAEAQSPVAIEQSF